MEADPLLAALHFADIDRVEIGFFRQFFLTHFGLFAVFSDRLTKNFAMLRNAGHTPQVEQEGRPENYTQHGCIFVLANRTEGATIAAKPVGIRPSVKRLACEELSNETAKTGNDYFS